MTFEELLDRTLAELKSEYEQVKAMHDSMCIDRQTVSAQFHMTYLKEGEKSHCGICKYCKRLWKSKGIYVLPNFKPVKSLCCVLHEDEIWEVNNANFCDYFDRKEDSNLK